MSDKIKNSITVSVTALFLFTLTVWCILKPDDIQSVSERRQLAARPQWSTSSVLSGKYMSDFEKYTLDQFPLRNKFRTLKAYTALYLLRRKDNNGIYVKDGYAVKLEYPAQDNSITYAAGRFRFIYDKYLKGNCENIYLSIIPDKNYWMEKSGYLTMDYTAFADKLRQQTAFAEYIDITGELTLSDYYKTDVHWRQERISDVAVLLAKRMGVTLKNNHSVINTGIQFFGVYLGQSALPLKADELYYIRTEALDSCTVYDYETTMQIPIYDLERLNGNDPYEMFLSGSKSLLSIESPNSSTEKELIIFRDSFSSSLAPLFAGGYRKITLVDIRYLSPNILDRFINFKNQDVLFLYSTSVLNNSITIK